MSGQLDVGRMAPAAPHVSQSHAALLLSAAAGAAVAVAAGVYGRLHTPTGQGIFTFGFRAVLPMKAWFATVAAALAIVQLLSAARMTRSAACPPTLIALHRWSGTAAFLFTLPVAYHCLWALGFDDTTMRTLVHSLAGCLFFGAFTTKMLVLRSDRVPGWSLPLIGGALLAALAVLWLTSSLWFFTTVGFPGT
jgi:hypothetical protein